MHAYEHSIEVQLPFLQFVNKDELNNIKIVPLIISDYDFDICREVGDVLADIDNDICVVASSDFTHYGSNYNYTPFSKNIKENMYKLDGNAIELIKEMKTKDFLQYVNSKGSTICGAGAIAIFMEIMKNTVLMTPFIRQRNPIIIKTSNKIISRPFMLIPVLFCLYDY